MKSKSAIDSITTYFLSHPEFYGVPSYVIYNNWAEETGARISDFRFAAYAISYIDDIKTMPGDVRRLFNS